jgi:hypothetical protein
VTDDTQRERTDEGDDAKVGPSGGGNPTQSDNPAANDGQEGQAEEGSSVDVSVNQGAPIEEPTDEDK